MARGRLIASDITRDKRINDLSNDTSRLAFTWLVTFADQEGRTYGDPALLRSMIFPRRADVTVDEMECYIAEWHASGLVIWYEANQDRWIQFPAFHKHQKGFDRRHEPDSQIPDPPAMSGNGDGECPDNVQATPVQCTAEVKRSEVKRSEGKPGRKPATPPTPPAVTAYRENANRYPPKSWYKQIADTVGEKPDDLGFWAMVVHAYVGNGWNPGNAKGMLEFYERREIPASNSKPQPRPPDILSEKRTAGPLPQDVEVKR